MLLSQTPRIWIFLQDEFHNSSGSSGGQVAHHSHDYHAQWIGATPFTRSHVQYMCITCHYNSVAHQTAQSFLEFKQPLLHCLVNTLPVASCSFKFELHAWLKLHHHPGPITIWKTDFKQHTTSDVPTFPHHSLVCWSCCVSALQGMQHLSPKFLSLGCWRSCSTLRFLARSGGGSWFKSFSSFNHHSIGTQQGKQPVQGT